MDAATETILLIDDDPAFLRVVSAVLSAGGYQVETASDVIEAHLLAADLDPAVAVVSLDLQSGSAEQLVRDLSIESPQTELIVLACPDSLDRLVSLYDLRALYNHRWKPLDEIGDLARDVGRAIERRALKRQNAYLLTELRDTRDELRDQAEYMMQMERMAAASRLVIACCDSAVAASEHAHPESARLLSDLSSLTVEFDCDWEIIDLAELLADALRLVEPLLVRSSIRPVFLAGPSESRVLALRSQVLQAILHILLNAADSMPSGGSLRLTCEPTPGERPGARFVIQDTGHGIDPETLPRVFEPFFTTRPSRSHAGLGLWSARSIIRRHDGEISIDTAVGRGTAFTVWLPAEAAVPQPQSLLRAA